MKKDKLVCSKCGGKNVQIRAWIDANTNKYTGDAMCEDEDTWCEDCEDHTGLVMKSEYNLNYNFNEE